MNFGKFPPAVTGLLKTGVRALRKSVYADGVGIELSLLGSRLISPALRTLGSSWISDGKLKDLGVFSGGRSGFWDGIVSGGAAKEGVRESAMNATWVVLNGTSRR